MNKLSLDEDNLIQGVPRDTDTFQSFIIKNWTTYESFVHIIKVSIKCHFFNNFDKTLNLNLKELTSVNSFCSIYFNEDVKNYQIYLRTVKLPNLTKNCILSNFD